MGKTISGSILLRGGAKLGAAADLSLKVGSFGMANALLEWLKSFQGGSWLPGKLTIDADGLRFQPNLMDSVVLKNADHINLKAAEIPSISLRPYLYGGIVEFHTSDGVISFWCWHPRQTATEAANIFGAKLA